jgi:hypothetical protein
MTENAKVSRLQLQGHAPTVEEAIHYAQKAAVEAYNEAKADKCDDIEAHLMAGEAYRNALPALTGRGNTQGFIAAVAEGVALRFITAPQARVLLYAAKLAIAAHAEVRA